MSWATLLLGDLVNDGHINIQTGPFGTQLKAADYTETGTPVINVRNIGYGSLRPDKLEHVPETVCDRLEKHLLSENDIVFGRKGAVDRHLLVQESQSGWMQGSDCIRMRFLSRSVIPKFISYALLLEKHKSWILTQCSNKATMASLNQDVICRIPLDVPDINTQQEIASILSAYDDLIENNRRRIQLLEQSARLLYKEWFVHLRFPGHEHVAIADGVPEGWERKTVGDLFSFFSRGITPKYDAEAPGIVINQKCIRNRLLDLELARHQRKEVPEDKLVRFGDILINSTGTGTLGRVAQVLEDLESCTVDSHVTIVRSQEKEHIFYLGLLLTNMESQIAEMGRGATNQTELSRSSISDIPALVPSKSIVLEFSSFAEKSFQQINTLISQNVRLAQARDILLPRLMNGDIAV